MIIKHLMVIHAKTLFCVEIGPARAGGAARARTEHARFVFQNPFFVGKNKIPSRKILLKRRIFKIEYDEEVYDDADLYQHLLKELVEAGAGDGSGGGGRAAAVIQTVFF